MIFFRVSVSILLLLISFIGHGQLFLNEVDFDKIEQKKICEFIKLQQITHIEKVSDIEPSVIQNTNLDNFRTCNNEYFVKDSLQKVWKYYTHSNPAKAWNGRKVTFGLLFSQKDKRIVYGNDTINGFSIGQIIYLNLKLLKGIKNLATSFELTDIDNENQIIEFSYVKGNSSIGLQRIQFFATSKGYTRILHTSYYKCHDLLKNYILYSFFHARATNEYHRNMRKFIKD